MCTRVSIVMWEGGKETLKTLCWLASGPFVISSWLYGRCTIRLVTRKQARRRTMYRERERIHLHSSHHIVRAAYLPPTHFSLVSSSPNKAILYVFSWINHTVSPSYLSISLISHQSQIYNLWPHLYVPVKTTSIKVIKVVFFFTSPQMLVDRLNNGGRNSVGPLRGQLDTDKQHLPIPSSSFSLSQEGKKEKREGFFFFFSIE